MLAPDDSLFGGLFALDPEPVTTPAPRPLSVMEELRLRPMPIPHGELINTYLGPLPCQWSRTEPDGSISASIRITMTGYLMGKVEKQDGKWQHVHHAVSPAPIEEAPDLTTEQRWATAQIERFIAAAADASDPVSIATEARDRAWMDLAKGRASGTDDGREVTPLLVALAATQSALFQARGGYR